MFTYAFKNLRALFTKQRLLAFLLLLNIIVSCLVICFSYGLYQNYNMIVKKGEEEEITYLDIRIKEEDTYVSEETHEATADIDPQMFVDFAKMLSSKTQANIDNISVIYLIDTPLCYIQNSYTQEIWNSTDWEALANGEADYPEYFIYKDDADTAYADVSCMFRPVGDTVVDAYIKKDTFDDDRYNNGDKIVVLESVFYDFNSGGTNALHYYPYSYRNVPQDIMSVIIAGERYEVVNILSAKNGETDTFGQIAIPITAIPEGALLQVSMIMGEDYGIEGQASCFNIFFKEPVTNDQYTDIKNCLDTAFGGVLFLPELEFTDAVDIYYYKTIMLIAVVIAVLAAINMAILYRYILEKRSSELAIFRICGCSKGKAIMSYLLECMIINIPLFALTQLIYHKLIMPRFNGLFPNMAGAYSFKLYAAIFGIYIGASMLIMLIMIAFTIWRHSLVDLKKSAKATTKFSIMKVFEVVQLSVVLSIMVLIVSVIVSRYELYNPFKQYFERRGYMVSDSGITFLNDFEDIIDDSEYIMTQFGGAVDGYFFSENCVLLNGIKYSDEFIEAYAPPLADGIWLSDTDDTYENSGYIPAVITSCDNRYKVGDIIENDSYAYDKNDQPVVMYHYKYKIIGVLKDNVSIASYMTHHTSKAEAKNDFRDIYNVFRDSYEDSDFLLTRYSDEYACQSEGMKNITNFDDLQWEETGGPLSGIQFIFCDEMPDDKYDELGRMLDSSFSTSAPLSQIRKNSLDYIYEQMYTLFPIAVCIFILTIISTVSISAIYTKRQLRNYAIFYICGARWRTCALKSLKNGAITCAVSAALSALILIVGKATLLKETVISFGLWHFAVCAGVIVLYLALSMIMPLSIIGSSEPREVLKEE